MVGESVRKCPECAGKIAQDIERGEIVCTVCGLVVDDNLTDENDDQGLRLYTPPPRQKMFETSKESRERVKGDQAPPVIGIGDEDPEWENSAVYVKKKPQRLDSKAPPSRKSIKQQIKDEAHRKGQPNPSVKRYEDALNYLDAHPSSHGKDRSHLFKPFYQVDEKGVTETMIKKDLGTDRKGGDKQDLERKHLVSLGLSEDDLTSNRGKEFADKVNNAHRIPGAICRLFDRTELPPRRYWLREGIDPEGPGDTQPADSIEPHKRVSFEMYLDLIFIQKRPWPLDLWCKHILLGPGISDVLSKGGALSRQASAYLLSLKSLQITKAEISGFMQNILDLSVADFSDSVIYDIEEEAFQILEEMRNSFTTIDDDGPEINFLDLFIQTNCLVASDSDPTQFWRLDRDKQIEVLGPLKLISIPIAFALAASVAMHLPELTSIASILELARADVKAQLSNCNNPDELDHCWIWTMGQIGRGDLESLLFK